MGNSIEAFTELINIWVNAKDITEIHKRISAKPSRTKSEFENFLIEDVWDNNADIAPKRGSAKAQRKNFIKVVKENFSTGRFTKRDNVLSSIQTYREKVESKYDNVNIRTERLAKPLTGYGDIIIPNKKTYTKKLNNKVDQLGKLLIKAKESDNKNNMQRYSHQLIYLQKKIRKNASDQTRKGEVIEESDAINLFKKIDDYLSVYNLSKKSKGLFEIRFDDLLHDKKFTREMVKKPKAEEEKKKPYHYYYNILKEEYKKAGKPLDLRKKQFIDLKKSFDSLYYGLSRDEIDKKFSQKLAAELKILQEPKIIIPKIEIEKRYSKLRYGEEKPLSARDYYNLTKLRAKDFREGLGLATEVRIDPTTKDEIEYPIRPRQFTAFKKKVKEELKPRFGEVKQEIKQERKQEKRFIKKEIEESIEESIGLSGLPKRLFSQNF